METFMDRLFVERNELKEKIEKLESALDNEKIPAEAMRVNADQLHAMKKYLSCLNEKIGMNTDN